MTWGFDGMLGFHPSGVTGETEDGADAVAVRAEWSAKTEALTRGGVPLLIPAFQHQSCRGVLDASWGNSNGVGEA